MIYIDITIAFVVMLLAVFSRKHYSKYKDRKIMCPIYAMADVIYEAMTYAIGGSRDSMETDSLKKWRQLYMTSDDELVRLRREHYVTGIAYCLCVVVTFAIIATICGSSANSETKGDNIILRADYDKASENYELWLSYGDREESYELNVAPLAYTLEEFNERASVLFEELAYSILGDNTSLDNITEDLSLADTDESGIFSITWKSMDPTIISSSGRLWEDASAGAGVTLWATVEYMEYSAEQSYTLVIGQRMSDENPVIASVKSWLSELEAENRTQRELVIPDTVEGVTISRKYPKKNLYLTIMSLALVICFALVCGRQIKINNMRKYRNNMLIIQYPLFVNRMCLLMGTGMTVKNCFIQYVQEDNKEDYLTKELSYMLNCISAGKDEASAYEELGRNLELPIYSRLMNHISRNLRMGTRNIRELMEDELHEAMELRKENARRKGEEASTKLLFPMIILLLVVMLIIVLPTMILI